MGFWNKLFRVKSEPDQPVVQQVDVTPAEKVRPQYAKLRRVSSPVLSFKMRTGVTEFEQPEYDMAESGRIEDVEAYVARAFSLKDGLMFKEGYAFTGKNPTTIEYVKRRFEQISMVTGLPTYLLAKGIGEDLVRLRNAFVIKVRDQRASGGKSRQKLGSKSTLQPVAGYFPAPVSTMGFKRDDYGRILKYQQSTPDGKTKEFDPDDVIHFFMNRKKGFLVGTPTLVPVRDDIRALRRIEENIEMLIYQNLFPLFQYIVGTEAHPAGPMPDGTREIDAVKQELEIMPAEGMIVTPERHEIKAIGSEGRALRAEGYLKHFRDRLFAGLGVSAIDVGLGETANRSTADSMSRNLVDDVKHYQQVFEEFFNEYIIKELLLESTFEDPLSEENIVKIKFNEIDLDAKIKVQNHAIQSFSGHAITHTEMRREFGLEPLTEEEWDDTFWKLIEEPKALIQAADEPFSAASQALARNKQTAIEPEDLETEQAGRDKEIAKTGKAPSGGSPGRKVEPKKSSGQRAAGAQTTPSNQHGRKTSPEKRKSSYTGNVTDMVESGNSVSALYDDLMNSTMNSLVAGTFTIDWFSQLALATETGMIEKLARAMRISFREGYRAILTQSQTVPTPDTTLYDRASKIVRRLVAVLMTQIKSVIDQKQQDQLLSKIVAIFDSLRYRSHFIFNTERNRGFNYGTMIAIRTLGDKSFIIEIDSATCEECRMHQTEKFMIQNMTLENIPPFHTNCTCRLKRAKTV